MKRKMDSYCSICGCQCTGNMRIIARGTKEYKVCSSCFTKYEFKDLKEVREAIKKYKLI